MVTDFINYLGFGGNCEQAFQFYEKAFDGKIIALLRYKDTPNGMHSVHSGHCINVVVDNDIDAEKYFTALSEGGTVNVPISESFWAHRFGMLVDKFGVSWMINHQKPMQ